jgi:TonB family protein
VKFSVPVILEIAFVLVFVPLVSVAQVPITQMGSFHSSQEGDPFAPTSSTDITTNETHVNGTGNLHVKVIAACNMGTPPDTSPKTPLSGISVGILPKIDLRFVFDQSPGIPRGTIFDNDPPEASADVTLLTALTRSDTSFLWKLDPHKVDRSSKLLVGFVQNIQKTALQVNLRDPAFRKMIAPCMTRQAQVDAANAEAAAQKKAADEAAAAKAAELARTTGPRVTLTSSQAAQLLISSSQPVYPAIARAARVRGNVLLQVIISTDGAVTSTQALSGPPMLQAAAQDSVRQRKYKPYVSEDGKLHEVQTTVVVNFPPQ